MTKTKARAARRVASNSRPPNRRNSSPEATQVDTELGPVAAILELHHQGYGFLRDPTNNYARRPDDPYVPARLISRFELREGAEVHGLTCIRRNQSGPRFVDIFSVGGCDPAEHRSVARFEQQTAVSPHRRICLETGVLPLTTRVMIFQEFKGTGNLEIVLDRDLADRRIWPALDIRKSGTRQEEKLLPPDVLHSVTTLRRALLKMPTTVAMEKLTARLARSPDNARFLDLIRVSAAFQ